LGVDFLYDPSGFVECVSDGRGSKVGETVSEPGIDFETRIGTARVEPKLDNFSSGVEPLIEFHVFPSVQSEIVDGGGILASEGEIRFTDGLEACAKDWSGFLVCDFKQAIQRAFIS
jgi:hypothetical protein